MKRTSFLATTGAVATIGMPAAKQSDRRMLDGHEVRTTRWEQSPQVLAWHKTWYIVDADKNRFLPHLAATIVIGVKHWPPNERTAPLFESTALFRLEKALRQPTVPLEENVAWFRVGNHLPMVFEDWE